MKLHALTYFQTRRITALPVFLKKLHRCSFLLFMLSVCLAQAQTVSISGVINIYTPVTALSSQTAVVGSSNGFNACDKVLIIQMKGVSIDSSNGVHYGDISAYNNAGNYELAGISGISGNVISFSTPLVRSYTPADIVQMVRVPQYTNVNITGLLTCAPWNGTTGGILVFEASNNVSMNALIEVDGKGFAGGQLTLGTYSCSGDTFNYVYSSSSPGSVYHAMKGEGVYNHSASSSMGKGKNASGGGGGNDINGGGAGGANAGEGGHGGNIYTSASCPPYVINLSGGIGGQALPYSAAQNKLFLGGGGGAGHQNDNASSPGANGGGMVLIRATTLIGNNYAIFANGQSAVSITSIAAIDGQGGGGAGGTVVLDIPSIANVTVSAAGGSGASDNYIGIDRHGTGGGGGGGVIWTGMPLPGGSFQVIAGWAGVFSNPGSLYYNTSYGATGGLIGSMLVGVTVPGLLGPASSSFSIVSSNSLSCQSPTTQLSVAGTTLNTYLWAGPGILGATTNSSVVVNAAGIYSLTGGSCNSTQTLTVASSIGPLPLNATASNSILCMPPPTVTLSASGAASYTWTPSVTLSTLTPGNSSVLANPATTTVYTVTGVTGICTGSAQVTLSLVPTPTLQFSASNPSLCAGSSQVLTALGAVSYTWVPPGVISNSIFASPGATTIYTVAGSNGPCADTKTTSLVVLPLPVVTATANGPVCEGGSLSMSLSCATPVTYSWSGPAGFASSSVAVLIAPASLANSGIYRVVAENADHCSSIVNITGSVVPIPVLAVSNVTTCLQEPTSLSAKGAVAYAWSGPDISSVATNSCFIAAPQHTGAVTYTVIGSSAFSCTATATAQVWIQGLPSASFSISPVDTVCLHSTLTLTGRGGVQYTWLAPDHSVFTGQSVLLSASNMELSGVYTLTVRDAFGCKNTANASVTIKNAPQVGLTGIKEGCAPFASAFQLSFPTGSPTSILADWEINHQHFSGPAFSYYFDRPGNYQVIGHFTDTLSTCSSSVTFSVKAHSRPVASFEYFPEVPLAGLEDVKFTSRSEGVTPLECSWFFPADPEIYRGDQLSYAYPEEGSYPVALVVRTAEGCVDTVVQTVLVEPDYHLYIPNSFTPNEDGSNDVFLPIVSGLTEYKLSVFDRWGALLFETVDSSQGWNGSFKGQLCKQDGYLWKLKVAGRHPAPVEKTGTVLLLR